MNKNQKRVLLVWMVALLVFGFLWVPWLQHQVTSSAAGEQVTDDLGYRPVFLPPFAASTGYPATARINVERLGTHLMVITLLAGGLLLYFKDSESEVATNEWT